MVEYGPDVTSTAYAIGITTDFYCGESGDEHTPFSFPSNAFNNVTASSGCVSRKLDGYTGHDHIYGNGLHIGQDFGAGNEKHIRKIRYQMLYNVSKINVWAGNDPNNILGGGGTQILNAYPVVQEDTGWNEILLPFTQPYRCWVIRRHTYGRHGYAVRQSIGEIEMMEAIPRVGASVFFL